MAYQPRLQSPPPVLNRRVLLRSFSLLLMAAFTVWAIWKARKPETWEWAAQVRDDSRTTNDEKAKDEGGRTTKDEGGRMKDEKKDAAHPSSFILHPSDEPVPNQIYFEQLGGLLSLTPVPTLTPGSLELRFLVLPSYEHAVPVVAVPRREPAGKVRRAPEPSQLILQKAADRQGFLLPDDPFNRKAEEDANARYHLIELATLANAEDMAADALREVPYLELIGDPLRFRGEVIHIEGTLRRVNRFQMSNPPPGVNQFYQGWLVAGRPDLDQVYCVLFAELPAGFPAEKDWLNHVVHGAKFDGYFLKVLRAEDSKDRRGRAVPVLIGKAVVPPPPGRTDEGAQWLSIGVTAVFIVAVFVCVLAVVLYRRGDRRVASRLAQLRNRARLGDNLAGPAPAEFPFENESEDPPRPRNGQAGLN